MSPPDVGALEEELVVEALRSGWVAPLGPAVFAFEKEVAEVVGREHAVALSSGTAALHQALMLVGVQAGDEVVVPTLTFGASAFAVTYVGARPVFIDSEPLSWNLDPELLAAFLERRAASGRLPSAVIVVDIFGQTADYARIAQACERFDVPLIGDAAESLGACHDLGMAGSFGEASIVSFNGNKIMTTSGGGMLLTDNAEHADRVRYLSSQARLPLPWYEHEEIGHNHRLSNILAALGRGQLRRLPEMIEKREAHRARYRALATGTEGIELVEDAKWGRSNSWLSIVRLEVGTHPGQPESLRQWLEARDIEARHVWKPMHRQPVFADAEAVLNGNADDLFATALCLPSGSLLSPTTIDHVCDAIGSWCDAQRN